MYADDTHSTYAGVDVNLIQSNLNHDLDNLNKWLLSNKLTLNSAKTEFIIIIIIINDIYPGSSTHSKVVFREVLHPFELD